MREKEVTIELYDPHKGQLKILENARRFNSIPCARRFGKTELIATVDEPLIFPALEGWEIGMFVPKMKDALETWKAIIETYRKYNEGGLILKANEQTRRIEFVGGGVLEWWGLWNISDVSNGKGRKYKRVIYDETQKIKSDILKKNWEEHVRPTLTDFKGDAYFLGNACGRSGYFYELCRRGALNGDCERNELGEIDIPRQDKPPEKNKSWITFRMTTKDNPHIDPGEVDAARNDLDEATYLQEYKSVFIEYAGEPWLYVLKDKSTRDRVFRRETPEINFYEPLYLSFDFNKVPMTLSVFRKVLLSPAQQIKSRYRYAPQFVKTFKEGEKGNEASIYDTCRAFRDWILIETGKKIGAWYDGTEIEKRYPCFFPFFVTGDASGDHADGRQKVPLTYFDIIKDELQLADSAFTIPSKNPTHAESFVVCNTMLSKNPEVAIYLPACEHLERDAIRIKSDGKRGILKKAGDGKQADHLDTFRYGIHNFCSDAKIY